MRFSSHRDRSHRPRMLLLVTGLCLIVVLGAATAACGGGGEEPDAGPFSGLWEPADSSLDIIWNEDEGKSYAVTYGGSGGGLEIDGPADALTVTMVGRSGARTDAFPATVDGDTLTFSFPIGDTDSTTVTMVLAPDGTAKIDFGGADTGWDFRTTDEITGGD